MMAQWIRNLAWFTAVACVQPLAWELPHAADMAKKREECEPFGKLKGNKSSILFCSSENSRWSHLRPSLSVRGSVHRETGWWALLTLRCWCMQ